MNHNDNNKCAQASVNSKPASVCDVIAMVLKDNKGIDYLKLHDPEGVHKNRLDLSDDDFVQCLSVRGLCLELTKNLGRLGVEDEDIDLLTDACHEMFDHYNGYWADRAFSGHDDHVWLQCNPDDVIPDWWPKFEDGSNLLAQKALKAFDFEVLDWLFDPLWVCCMVLPDPEKKVTNVMKKAAFYALQGLMTVKPMSYIEIFLNDKLNEFVEKTQDLYGSYADVRLGCQQAFCDAAGISEEWIPCLGEVEFENWKELFVKESQMKRDIQLLKQMYVIEDRPQDFARGSAMLRHYHYDESMNDEDLKKLGTALAQDPRITCLLHHTLFQMADFSVQILKIASHGNMFLCD